MSYRALPFVALAALVGAISLTVLHPGAGEADGFDLIGDGTLSKLAPTSPATERILPPVVPDSPFRFAVAPDLVPEGSEFGLRDLCELVGVALSRDGVLALPASPTDAESLVRNGGCDAAMISTQAYAEGHADFSLQALVIPLVREESSPWAVVVVHSELDPHERYELLGAFIQAGESPKGARVLSAIGIDAFSRPRGDLFAVEIDGPDESPP